MNKFWVARRNVDCRPVEVDSFGLGFTIGFADKFMHGDFAEIHVGVKSGAVGEGKLFGFEQNRCPMLLS